MSIELFPRREVKTPDVKIVDGAARPVSEICGKAVGNDFVASLAAEIPEEIYQKCIHCGLCTSSCPTYAVGGNENDSPRGRLQLMRSAAEGREEVVGRMKRHVELCLDCRACETACPSGVEYSRVIEPFRRAVLEQISPIEERQDWFRKWVVLGVLPYPERLRKLLAPVRLLQHLGAWEYVERLGLLKLLPGRLGRLASLLPPPMKQGPRLPRFLPAVGRKRARIAFFTGCAADALMRNVHWATLRVLQENGCDIFIPTEQVCCGAMHHHAGDSLGARHLADQNLVAFELDRFDAIVVNHAGCGAMLKEYGRHWKDGLQPHRQKFAEKVRDVHEFLDDLGFLAPSGRLRMTVTYHDACHLAHAQKITSAPRKLLSKVPELEIIEMPESDMCCGSAGVYNLNEAAMADKLASRKIDNILSTGASAVLAANVGCLLQIDRELRARNVSLPALHPMELLDWSYREESPVGVFGGRR